VKDYMTHKKPAPPLDNRRLRDLALHYAGRYATTKAKLSNYLTRKIGERGWKEGEPRADLDVMMQDFAELGYVNDAAYAGARARSLLRRGYGARRLDQDLYAAGISDTDAAEARAEISDSEYTSAHAFARKKRIGPYASTPAEPDMKRKQIAAFLRAGHGFEMARRFVDAAPGDIVGDN
jgi:regulatory protein